MTTALLNELLDFCCMAISASNTELRILFNDKFYPKEIPDNVRGAPALREYYISCLLEESDIILKKSLKNLKILMMISLNFYTLKVGSRRNF